MVFRLLGPSSVIHRHTKSIPLLIRRFSSLPSTRKDPDLESALTRNKRWIINSRLKNIILRCPNQTAPVKFLQKKFKSLDLQGKALNWVKKYPCCFDVYLEEEDNEYYCRLTKPMMALVEEEEVVKEAQEGVLAGRLAKLLMMSVDQRLNVVKLNELKRSFGFGDDYVVRIVGKYGDLFRLVNYSGRKSSLEIELLSWKPELAVSAVEVKCGSEEVCFSCSLPTTWTNPWERFLEFNASPYVSPYQEGKDLVVEGEKESEKRSVGLVHELLSLTLWKKMSMVKLSHFKKEFGLPERLNGMLLRHPGIFYVSNKYQVHTVVLREGYDGSELIQKDPLVVVKDKFGELMQQGLYEYNRRRYLANLEKKREKGIESVKSVVRKRDMIDHGDDVDDEQKNHGDRPGGMFDPEERKRFYQILFSDSQ
ncbi:unnamed protein product [Eruca vesicaria subsp. sativa]|uniref:PORR domain-containing protein n=1 Tax=Eruca vesicaria subsp. sativa TaxID=29727 RepID=A0ABC8LSE2_ERUVS|nr:unnamed protein product [Eruca vesicaria subsp. sativa]